MHIMYNAIHMYLILLLVSWSLILHVVLQKYLCIEQAVSSSRLYGLASVRKVLYSVIGIRWIVL